MVRVCSRKVILPAALPAIFTGLRLGLGLALVAIVAVEFIAAKSGLGHLVYRHWQTLSTPQMYGAFALVGALGLLLTRGLRALQARTAGVAGGSRPPVTHYGGRTVMRSLRTLVLVSLLIAVVALAAGGAVAQAPAVKIGYIPSDSFAALYIMADRYLTPAGITVQMVRLPSGAEITTQVATGQLQVGGSGMGAAGFNAVAAKLPIEFIAPLHFGYLEDYFTVRKAVWGTEVKRIADLKGRTVGLNTRGAAVEWMLDQVLRRDGLTIKDVQVKIMPFPDMVPALESGAIDAGILTEPFPTLAEDKGVGVRPLPQPAGAKAIPITAAFWNAEWARANARARPQGDARLPPRGARSGGRRRPRLDRGPQRGPHVEVRRHQEGARPEGAAPRGRSQPRAGRQHARQHAEAERRPRLPQVHGVPHGRQAVHLHLP